MQGEQPIAAVAIDLTRLHRRTVTSFYNNLVTRPTGRAVRLGVEQQLTEVGVGDGPCLSILDFSQVQVMDYSCADEIVAKLLIRYAEADRPVNAYFLGRGLMPHHHETLEAVLERHRLLLVIEQRGGSHHLLGPTTTTERACWSQLVQHGGETVEQLTSSTRLVPEEIAPAVRRLVGNRVAVSLQGDRICPLPRLNHR